jgi:hypothetical protein
VQHGWLRHCATSQKILELNLQLSIDPVLPNFILGVCILLRVRDQVMAVFISVYATSLLWVNFTTYIIILLYVSSYDHHQAENILLARITQLTTD